VQLQLQAGRRVRDEPAGAGVGRLHVRPGRQHPARALTAAAGQRGGGARDLRLKVQAAAAAAAAAALAGQPGARQLRAQRPASRPAHGRETLQQVARVARVDSGAIRQQRAERGVQPGQHAAVRRVAQAAQRARGRGQRARVAAGQAAGQARDQARQQRRGKRSSARLLARAAQAREHGERGRQVDAGEQVPGGVADERHLAWRAGRIQAHGQQAADRPAVQPLQADRLVRARHQQPDQHLRATPPCSARA